MFKAEGPQAFQAGLGTAISRTKPARVARAYIEGIEPVRKACNSFEYSARKSATGPERPLLCTPGQILEFTRLFLPKITSGLYCEESSTELSSIWYGSN